MEDRELTRVIERAKEGIQKATDVSDVKHHLENLVEFLLKYQQESTRSNAKGAGAFVEFHYHTLVEFLFDHITSEWLICFNATERKKLFNVFFLPIEEIHCHLKTLVPPVYTFLSLTCLLGTSQSSDESISLQMKPGWLNAKNLNC